MWAWVPALIGAAFFALAGVVWKLLNDKIERNDKALWDQIGRDSNSGMRVHVHDVINVKSNQQYLHDRIERLEKWRNGKP